MVAKSWRKIKGYNRDYVLKNALEGKTWSKETFVKEGAKLDLKPITMRLKLRRWSKAGLVTADKKGKIVFK